MGILGLSRLIADIAPDSIREIELKSLFGRRIAIDASMSIYQFLIAIRNREQMMTNDAGDATSHLIGMFYRTIKLLEVGIKPVYVFDGKAPELKMGELTKRKERREEAEAKLAAAKETQDQENISKFNKRLVRVTRQHNDDCKKLLRLIGLPIIEAPSEAEAQCAQLCKEGLVYATATEDMDALTFGSPRLLRNLTSGGNEKLKEYQLEKVLNGFGMSQRQFIDLGILMGCDYCDSIKGIGGKKGLDLIKKFGSIESILEKKYGISNYVDADVGYGERKDEEIQIIDNENGHANDGNGDVKDENGDVKDENDDVKDENDDVKDENDDDVGGDDKNDSSDIKETPHDDSSKLKVDDDSDGDGHDINKDDKKGKSKSKGKNKSKDKASVIPENWLFIGARKLFEEPNTLKGEIKESDLKQKDIDDDGIVQLLCVENGFSEDRVRNALKRVKEAKGKCNQSRIDTFFKAIPSNNKTPDANKSDSGNKSVKRSSTKKGPNKKSRAK